MSGKVQGFRFGAVSAGIRKDGRIDLALAVCDRPAVTAALFTRNLVKAAPVLVAAERASAGLSRAVLANAGCANAVTGEQGLRAVQQTTASHRQGARHLARRGAARLHGRDRRAPAGREDRGAGRRAGRQAHAPKVTKISRRPSARPIAGPKSPRPRPTARRCWPSARAPA